MDGSSSFICGTARDVGHGAVECACNPSTQELEARLKTHTQKKTKNTKYLLILEASVDSHLLCGSELRDDCFGQKLG